MHQVQAAVDVVLQLLRDKQQPLIEDALRAAASNGAGLTTQLGKSAVGEAITALPHAGAVTAEVLTAVLHGTAEDGLTLSDRIWRNHVALRQARSEEHTSELQSLMRISYADFCLKKQTTTQQTSYATLRRRRP